MINGDATLIPTGRKDGEPIPMRKGHQPKMGSPGVNPRSGPALPPVDTRPLHLKTGTGEL